MIALAGRQFKVYKFCLSSLPFELDNRAVQNPVVSLEASHLIFQPAELSPVFHLSGPVAVVIFLLSRHFPAKNTRRKKIVHTNYTRMSSRYKRLYLQSANYHANINDITIPPACRYLSYSLI